MLNPNFQNANASLTQICKTMCDICLKNVFVPFKCLIHRIGLLPCLTDLRVWVLTRSVHLTNMCVLYVIHTHQVPGTGSPVPSPLPTGWQRAAGDSGAAGWAQLRFVPPATCLPAPRAHGPPPPPAGSSPRLPVSSALADWARSDSESPHLQKMTALW